MFYAALDVSLRSVAICIIDQDGNAMLMRSIRWTSLKAWGVKLMKTKGRRRAIVAVARKIAVILHRMWGDGSNFRLGSEATA